MLAYQGNYQYSWKISHNGKPGHTLMARGDYRKTRLHCSVYEEHFEMVDIMSDPFRLPAGHFHIVLDILLSLKPRGLCGILNTGVYLVDNT